MGWEDQGVLSLSLRSPRGEEPGGRVSLGFLGAHESEAQSVLAFPLWLGDPGPRMPAFPTARKRKACGSQGFPTSLGPPILHSQESEEGLNCRFGALL